MPVRKRMLSIQNMRSLFLTGIKGTKNYFLCLINGGTENLINIVSRVFIFVGEAEHSIRLVMQNKSRP